MIVALQRLVFVLSEFLRAPLDVLRGISRRSYMISADVAAPKSVTWAVMSAHKIRLEGNPPIDIDAAPVPSRPGIYSGSIAFSGRTLPFAYEILDERPGEALSLRVIKEESAPECCPGEDYLCASAVAGDETQSTIALTYEITHTGFTSRLMMPLAAVQNAGRIKKNAELRAGHAGQPMASKVKNAVVTGALTLASFSALFGLADAAMLVGLILIHEVGHVIGMRWAGLPVKGIYFVPFFGGVAVSDDRYKNEAERGLVALMGPGFSLISTAIFFVLAAQSPGDETLRNLALMSAILNGLNLLPVLPLDGGHIAQSLLSRQSAAVTVGFNSLTVCAGLSFAILMGAYDLLLILLLIVPFIFSKSAQQHLRLPPLTAPQLALLSIGYAATLAFYAAVVWSIFNGSPGTA